MRRQVHAWRRFLAGVRLRRSRGIGWGWGGAGPSVVACRSCVCALVSVVVPSPSVPGPLVLPFPGPLVVSCGRVVSPPVPCPCGRLPATLGLSSPPCRGPPICPFPSRCGGCGVGGGPLGRRWPMSGCGWSGPTGAGFQGCRGGHRPWTVCRRRASRAASGMAASGAASLGSAGVRVQISSKKCTMCSPSRPPAPPAHFTQRRSSRKAGGDHQARWAGPGGGRAPS